MKKLLLILSLSLSIFSVYSQRKTLYSHAITHTNLIVEGDKYILNSTYQKAKGMYRKEIESIDIVSLTKAQMVNLLNDIIRFSESSEIGDTSKHGSISISSAKKFGVRHIVLKNGDRSINTNAKAIKEALSAIK